MTPGARRLAVLGLALGSLGSGAGAQTPARDSAQAWFRNAKAGLFIHWGVYSLLADGEWVMENRGITAAEYETIPRTFNPTRFDARAWVALAQQAGLRYLTVTTKHHDGFALWDSKVTDWDVIDRTPFGRDPIAELAQACREAGMPLFLYYSQLDWHHPDYFPRGGTGRRSGRPERGDFDRYRAFMNAQLRELLGRHGPVAGIWLDGMWDNGAVDWRLADTYRMIHELAPGALIGSNHNGPPHPGEDLILFEDHVRPELVPPGNQLPIEVSQKINDTWGFRVHDRKYQSAAQLIRDLVNAAGRDANFLVNVGPMADGTVQSEFTERLAQLGDWLRRNGASIYQTRGGPIGPRPWGVTTINADTVYLHLLDWNDRQLSLPALPHRVLTAKALDSGAALRVTSEADGLVVEVPPHSATNPDYVIALTMEHR